jgi:hypothetical protein
MHQNEKIIRMMDEAQSKGDFQTMFSVFADDVVAHMGGRSKLAGDVKGKEQLQGLFGRMMQATGENVRVETHDVVAGDEHGFMLHHVHGERGGRSIEIHSTDIFHFSGGKISEAWFNNEDPYTADAWYDEGLS